MTKSAGSGPDEGAAGRDRAAASGACGPGPRPGSAWSWMCAA